MLLVLDQAIVRLHLQTVNFLIESINVVTKWGRMLKMSED